jgi:hypothetical protein
MEPQTGLFRTSQQQQPFLLSRAKTGSTGKKTREQTDEEEHNRDEQKERR